MASPPPKRDQRSFCVVSDAARSKRRARLGGKVEKILSLLDSDHTKKTPTHSRNPPLRVPHPIYPSESPSAILVPHLRKALEPWRSKRLMRGSLPQSRNPFFSLWLGRGILGFSFPPKKRSGPIRSHKEHSLVQRLM